METKSETVRAIAHEIAQALTETDPVPLLQIGNIVELAGEEFARGLLQETLEIEAKGGLLVHDTTRRRTLGGVYFFLAKGKLPVEIRSKIFPNLTIKGPDATLEWDERLEPVQALLATEKIGADIRNMVIQITGRVTELRVMEDTVLFKMIHSHEEGSYPRGVPHPPMGEPTTYMVYVGIKHWEKVKPIIEDPREILIIEGSCFLDKATGTIAVFPNYITTKEMRKKENRQLIGTVHEELPKPVPSARPADKDKRKDTKGASKPMGGKLPPKSNNIAPARPPSGLVPPPVVHVILPAGVPADIAAKLQQLHQAAATLRERIVSMETKNQPGVTMTRKLLENTQKQIDAIERQYN
jgi:hypothetical protein